MKGYIFDAFNFGPWSVAVHRGGDRCKFSHGNPAPPGGPPSSVMAVPWISAELRENAGKHRVRNGGENMEKTSWTKVWIVFLGDFYPWNQIRQFVAGSSEQTETPESLPAFPGLCFLMP